MLADVAAKTLTNTLVEVRAEALVNAMGKTLEEVKFVTLSNTLPKERENALVDALADTQAEVEPETLSEHCPKAKALLDALAEPVQKKQTQTLIKRLVKVTHWLK